MSIERERESPFSPVRQQCQQGVLYPHPRVPESETESIYDGDVVRPWVVDIRDPVLFRVNGKGRTANVRHSVCPAVLFYGTVGLSMGLNGYHEDIH